MNDDFILPDWVSPFLAQFFTAHQLRYIAENWALHSNLRFRANYVDGEFRVTHRELRVTAEKIVAYMDAPECQQPRHKVERRAQP